MHVKLLRKVGKSVDKDQWPKVLLKFVKNNLNSIRAYSMETETAENEDEDGKEVTEEDEVVIAPANNFDDVSNEYYDGLPVSKKLSLLRDLLECQFFFNNTAKKHISDSYKGNLHVSN
jgi:hypothetical protein